jgi:hypothetical protein
MGLGIGVRLRSGAICAIVAVCGCSSSRSGQLGDWNRWSYHLDSLAETPPGEPEASYSVLRAGADRLVVMHRSSMSVFTSTGEFVAKLGRSGSGPGELAMVTQVGRMPDGRVWIWDSMLGRFLFLDADVPRLIDDTNRPNGPFRRTTVAGVAVRWERPLAYWGSPEAVLMLGFPDGGDVVPRAPGEAEPDATQRVVGWPYRDGSDHGRVVAAYYGDIECVVTMNGQRNDLPQCPKRQWGVSRDGRLAVIAVPVRYGVVDSYRFTVISTQSGDTVYSKEIRLIGAAVSQEVREEYRAKLPQGYKELSHPERLATVRYVQMGNDGTLWVGGIVEGDNRWWHVIDPAGKPHAALIVPDDLYIQEVSVDGALATLDHENGQIILYHLALDGSRVVPFPLEGR